MHISQCTLVLLSARAHPLIYSVDGIDSIGLYGINGATEDARRRDARRRADQSALTIARQGETYWRLHNASRDCTRCNQRCRFHNERDGNTRSLMRGIRYLLPFTSAPCLSNIHASERIKLNRPRSDAISQVISRAKH